MSSDNYRRYALAAMTAIYTLNLVDRGLMGLLLQSIKMDLHLSDTQLGFVTGIAFGLFYATLGVPLARWADRGNRVTIASLAIGLWGLTVMACFFVTSYAQLVCARVAAAVGESGCKPPTYSLIGDYYPGAAERTRAISVWFLGSPASTLISFLGGGWLSERYGWRTTFLLMGIPGLLLALVFKLTVVEPRTRKDGALSVRRSIPPLRAVLLALWEQQSSRNLCVALILFYTVSFGMWPWFSAFMIRSHGASTGELGVWLGLIFSIGGVVGTLLGAYVANRWFAGDERGQMRMSAVAVAAVVPFFVAFLMVPGKFQALATLLPLIAVFSFFVAPTFAIMQRLVPEQMRATVMATIMLLANLIGMGIGPQVVGILSDAMRPALGVHSLRYAMMMVSFTALGSAWHLWKVSRTVAADLAQAG